MRRFLISWTRVSTLLLSVLLGPRSWATDVDGDNWHTPEDCFDKLYSRYKNIGPACLETLTPTLLTADTSSSSLGNIADHTLVKDPNTSGKWHMYTQSYCRPGHCPDYIRHFVSLD